ncbi:MAG: hypothetical protein ACLQLC_08810 [Candidatus Sulfotelmatobacter sp.]
MAQFTRVWDLLPASEAQPLPYSRQEWDTVSRSAEIIAQRLFGKKLIFERKKSGRWCSITQWPHQPGLFTGSLQHGTKPTAQATSSLEHYLD